MDKIQKIREEVVGIINSINLFTPDEDGKNSSYEAGKLDVASKILQVIDSMQEEPVSEELEEASKEWLRPQLDKSYANYGEAKMMELTHFDGYAMLDAIEFGANWQKAKDESITEDLEEYINELSKQFQEVSFAKLSRIAVRVAKWQKEQFEKNRLAACDRQTEEEAEREQEFVMGIIENEHRKPTFNDAIKYGMRLNKEQMMKDTVEAKVYNKAYPTEFEIETNTFMQKLKHGDNVKLIIIKEN